MSSKSHKTKEGLIVITPNGALIFISELYSCKISDRELTIESGFLDFLDPDR